MNRRAPILLAFAALLQAQAPPPRPAVVRAARPAVPSAEARLRKDTAFLASPELKGRGNGEAGLEQAAAHVLARYRALGIPAQVLRMPFPTAVERVEAEAALNFGDGEARTLAWGKDVEAMWASGDASFRYKALVFAGYGLGAPARQDLDNLELRGKVVMMLREIPASVAAAAHLSPLETSPLARAKALLAARPAAVVFLEEGSTVPPMARMDGAATLPIPMLAMTVEAAAKVCPDLQDRIARLKATGERQSKDYVYAPWSYINLTLQLKRVEAQLPIVVAQLKGGAAKDEFIALGAHLDHLGTTGRHSMAGAGKEQPHPGADDNASGTALVLELAQSLKSARPKRSLLFMHFSGEEEGLLGSAWWMQHPTVPKEQVRFMANFDMVGRLDPARPTLQLGVYGAPRTAFERAKALAPAGLAVQGGDGLPAGGSDHMSFAAGRIPTFFFFTGLHADYHRPSDTADKLNLKGMAQLAAFARDVVLDLANAAEVPAFDPETAKPPKALASPMRIAFGTLPDYAANPKGFRITGVSSGGTAEAIGLKEGDIIIEFGGRPIRDIQDYMAALGAFKPGDKVLVKWLRGEATLQAEAVLKGRS